MTSGYRIEWSARATENFDFIIRFLSENWGKKEIRKFVRTIDKKISYIRSHSQAYPNTSYYPGLRKCVVSKLHTLYYLVRNDVIYIVVIWDNLSNNTGLQQIMKQDL